MQRSNHRLKFTNKYVEHLIFNKYVEQICRTKHLTFGNVILGIRNISFDNSMQWMNKMWI